MKELLLQSITDNLDYSPPTHLHRIFNALAEIPLRYQWYGFYPESLSSALANDILIATRMICKLGIIYLLEVHALWFTRCYIIHATSSDKIAAEEILDLQDEIIDIQQLTDYFEIITSNNIDHLTDLTPLSATTMKGWLFDYYSVIENYDKYNEINRRGLRHKAKVCRDSSSDDLSYRASLSLLRKY